MSTPQFETFGKYVLLEKLATGGMAEVFLARGTGAGGIGKFFAIKRILPQYADSPEFIEMFKDEAKIAINLSHSNIVSIHEFGVEKGQFFLVMDYVEGRNLRQILNKMKKTGLQFSIDQIVFVIKEVAAGLDHAHRCIDGSTGKPLNITHRDMSPQNVMVSFEGEVKIVDFGIAKAESQIETTRAGTLKGKFGYMSPEQAEGQPVDLRTDIFSLGIVLWELLAHDRLFVANNEINTLRKIRDCQIPSLRKINPNIHSELERIVQKGLARDRNLRYQTGAAIHRDLNRFLNRQYPDFSPQDFSVFIKSVFADEILSLRKRLVEYAKVNLSVRLNIPKPAKDEDTFLMNTNTNSFVDTDSGDTGGSMDGLPKEFIAAGESESAEKAKTAASGLSLNLSQISISRPSDTQATMGKSVTLNVPQVSQVSLLSATLPSTTGDITSTVPTGPTGATETPMPSMPVPEQAARTNPGTPVLLDDKALAQEASREIMVSQKVQPLNNLKEAPTSNSEPVETESLDSSYAPDRRTTARASTAAYEERADEPQKPMRFATVLVFTLLCVSAYAYLVKYFTGTMTDVIRVTDPVLHELHVALGVTTPERTPGSFPPPKTPAVAAQSPAPEQQMPLAEPDQMGMVVTSNPSGAEIFLNGISTGLVTPSRIEVPAQETFTISVRKRGYYEYKRTEVTRDSVGHRLDATLQKLNLGYVDVEIFPPQDAVLYVNGRAIRVHRNVAQVSVPGNVPTKIRAESRSSDTYDETTVTVATDRRKSIKLNPRKMSRTPANQ